MPRDQPEYTYTCGICSMDHPTSACQWKKCQTCGVRYRHDGSWGSPYFCDIGCEYEFYLTDQLDILR